MLATVRHGPMFGFQISAGYTVPLSLKTSPVVFPPITRISPVGNWQPHKGTRATRPES